MHRLAHSKDIASEANMSTLCESSHTSFLAIFDAVSYSNALLIKETDVNISRTSSCALYSFIDFFKT